MAMQRTPKPPDPGPSIMKLSPDGYWPIEKRSLQVTRDESDIIDDAMVLAAIGYFSGL